MDIKKTLLVKSLRELLTITDCTVTATNGSHRYSIERDQNEHKFTVVEGTSEKLRRMLRSRKIRSTFYIESTLRKLFCKPKNRVATDDKDNIVYEIDCSNYEAVYFSESKRSLKLHSDEHKRSVRNCDCDKTEIAKHCWEADNNFSWDQKKVIDRVSRLVSRKIKETIPSLKNSNHLNKISYMLPEIWLPNLPQFLVNYICHMRRF